MKKSNPTVFWWGLHIPVFYAAWVHIWWGIAMFFAHPAKDWDGGVFWNPYVVVWQAVIGESDYMYIVLASIFLAVGTLSAVFCFTRSSKVWALMPQQVLLFIGALGVVFWALDFGHDYAVSRILRVTPTAVAAFAMHTWSIVVLSLLRGRE